jgi:hypothetical protein
VEGTELLVVVVLFLVGYWLVDFFWPKKKQSSDAPAAAPVPGQPTSNENAPWHEVLGVAPDATPEQIRKAYEEKSAQYHPNHTSGHSGQT